MSLHPLTDPAANEALESYDRGVKDAFDRIVPVLKRLSGLQHEPDFIPRAQALAQEELGYSLPLPILEKAWVSQLDMRSLFAWCVFETYEQTSESFFRDDPLAGQPGSPAAEEFNAFLLSCGFHLLDVTPCADGRLAHAIAFALRLPFSSVRRRPHAGALFDVENTVNRWVKTEHRRYREGVPNPAHDDTRYLKVVLYHFSSRDPSHEGCAAHGSDDALAASCGRQRLKEFQQAVENSFCCGASVDLLLLGIDTDTDAIRVHVPGMDGSTRLDHWLDAAQVYEATRQHQPEGARAQHPAAGGGGGGQHPRPGHGAPDRPSAGAQHLPDRLRATVSRRALRRCRPCRTVHRRGHRLQGNPSAQPHLLRLHGHRRGRGSGHGRGRQDLPGPQRLPGPAGARGGALRLQRQGAGGPGAGRAPCPRVGEAIENRYPDLFSQGLLHALLTVRDQERHTPAEAVGSTIHLSTAGGH